MSPPLSEKSLGAVSRERLRERTAAELRDYVLVNRLAPGTQLPAESALAETLGVSRNIVRQAVASLEGLGMLRVSHGSGTYVADPVDSEVFQQIAAWIGPDSLTEADYFEVRSIWERGVYALVMERASDEDLEQLDRLAAELVTAEDAAAHAARHRDFHDALFRCTKNPFLVTIGTILARFLWEFGYRYAAVRKPPEPQLFDVHRELVRLLRRRDPSALQEMVSLHLSPEATRERGDGPAGAAAGKEGDQSLVGHAGHATTDGRQQGSRRRKGRDASPR